MLVRRGAAAVPSVSAAAVSRGAGSPTARGACADSGAVRSERGRGRAAAVAS